MELESKYDVLELNYTLTGELQCVDTYKITSH
jgi:hypothetical protein